jgi:phosphoglycerate dehydrogenase-like enzyme
MVDCSPMPRLLVSAGTDLFSSFFPPGFEARLGRWFNWQRTSGQTANMAFTRKLATADALLTTWDSPYLGEDLLQTAPKLRIIAHCGGEVKSRFAARLFDKLMITNAANPMARATAELGATFLLYFARDVDRYREALRKPSNRVYLDVHLHGTEEHLANREVAMIGFGRVGRALVDLLRGFDLHWLVYDPYAPRSLSEQYPIVFSELKPLLKRADMLVLTAALTDRTRNLLDRKALSLLPDGAAVINIARGGLVDLAALTKEVRRKRLRCAADVTDPDEPLPVKHPLRKLSGAIVTPHVAGSSRQVRQQIAATVMDDLENFFSGKPVKNRVTRAMLDRMT